MSKILLSMSRLMFKEFDEEGLVSDVTRILISFFWNYNDKKIKRMGGNPIT